MATVAASSPRRLPAHTPATASNGPDVLSQSGVVRQDITTSFGDCSGTDLAAATDDANKIATSQIALPEDACAAVFATSGYEQSVRNMQQVSLDSDNVFREDGGARQLGTISGSVEAGYTVELAVAVQAG